MHELKLETRDQDNLTPTAGPVMLTPPISEDYWSYRVRVADGQAIVAFPKFGVIGIGFAVEEDWNTNLPSDCSAEEIYDHIEHNRGDESITRETCVAAIRMIQDAIAAASAKQVAAHKVVVAAGELRYPCPDTPQPWLFLSCKTEGCDWRLGYAAEMDPSELAADAAKHEEASR